MDRADRPSYVTNVIRGLGGAVCGVNRIGGLVEADMTAAGTQPDFRCSMMGVDLPSGRDRTPAPQRCMPRSLAGTSQPAASELLSDQPPEVPSSG